MKIAIFRTDSSSQDPASYNSQEMGLAKGLRKLGHVVDIIMASSTGHYSEKVIDDTDGAIRIIELPFRIIPLLNEPFYPKVYKILSKNKYDYVQINEEGNFASYLIARVCNKNDLKFGIYQGMYRTLSGRKWALYEAIHHRFFRPLLRTRSVGAFCKTSLAGDYLSSKGYKKTHVVPVGLDFSKFRIRENRDWRNHLNIGADAQLILYVGSLEKRRNPQFIADLACNARADQHFVLVGRGPCQSDVETAIIKNSKNNLHLVGQLSQKELPALYEQADVFVLPSDYEIYGMVVAESLAFGTPVISTRTAGPVDIIESEEQGSLISYLDVDIWLKAIDFYGISSKNKSEMGLRIRNAESRFDWVSIARKYVELVS
ncbi:glycosyltransferase family 4 protein [Marinobacter salexigens]|uniref:Glycosyltransferase family 4 protein n=1 Tax=Marinobacter salexigens TaxID=1925763 RepID=A0ABS6AED5_9GAMM|nr:glycosyltransferase family 4 protein [Marinobacter salexigens]MBU2875239.1 glycosyltransferase family 4 protein [Marinobacter salexigens]